MEENPLDPVHNLEDHPEFFQRELRSLEFRAYASILSAFRAGGELDEEKRGVLNIIRQTLNISELRHKSEVRRVATNLRLTTIANKLHGHNTSQEWLDEGFCESPYIIPLGRFPSSQAPLFLASPSEEEPFNASTGTSVRTRFRHKINSIHDFGRAVKVEKNLEPFTLHNGWVSEVEQINASSKTLTGNKKQKRGIKAEKVSDSSSSDSESSVDISYHSLKKQGRIRYQKTKKLKLKEIKNKKKISLVSETPKVIKQERSSPDITESKPSPVKQVSPIKKETSVIANPTVVSKAGRGRGAKRKILTERTKQIPKKIKKLNNENANASTNEATTTEADTNVSNNNVSTTNNVTNNASTRGAGKGSRGVRGRGISSGLRGRGGLGIRGGRGRASLKGQPRAMKIQTKPNKIPHKRKQLDAVRVELKSDDSDKEDNKFGEDVRQTPSLISQSHSLSPFFPPTHPSNMDKNREKSPDKVKSDTSESSDEQDKEKEDENEETSKIVPETNNNNNNNCKTANNNEYVPTSDEGRLDEKTGDYIPIKTENHTQASLVHHGFEKIETSVDPSSKLEKSPIKTEPEIEIKPEVNVPEKPKTPPKVPVRNPLPVPVFSTSLNNLNLKRTKLINNYPPSSETNLNTSTASSLATTASSLARRPVFSSCGSTPGIASKGITPKPGILPLRKAQPHILVNSKAQRNMNNNLNNNIVSSSNNVTNLSSGVPLMSNANNPLLHTNSGGGTPKPGFNIPISSIQNFPVVHNSQFAPVSYGPVKTSQGANIIFLQKATNSTSVLTGSNAVGTASSIQQMPNKNSPRAVILRRANLPRQGNVMILDMQKNQVVNANQMPQFFQNARILNAPPEMALLAQLEQPGLSTVRKIVSGAQVSTTPSLSSAASNSIVSAAICSTAASSLVSSSSISSNMLGSTSTSNAITLSSAGGFPLRFPINSSRLQQFQASPAFKGKRVARVLSPAVTSFAPTHPENMKTVIRVNFGGKIVRSNVQVPSTSDNKPSEHHPQLSTDFLPSDYESSLVSGVGPMEEAGEQPVVSAEEEVESSEVPLEPCYEEEVVTTSAQEIVSCSDNDGNSNPDESVSENGDMETETIEVQEEERNPSPAVPIVETIENSPDEKCSEEEPRLPSQEDLHIELKEDRISNNNFVLCNTFPSEQQQQFPEQSPPEEESNIEIVSAEEIEVSHAEVPQVSEIADTIITTSEYDDFEIAATTTVVESVHEYTKQKQDESEDIFQAAMKCSGLDQIQQAFELTDEAIAASEEVTTEEVVDNVPFPVEEVTATCDSLTEPVYEFEIPTTCP